MPRPNMISGNYNYLGVGGHYKSGIAGLGNVTQGELNNAGLSISEWQHLLANLNDDAAYGPGGYNTPGLRRAGLGLGLGLGTLTDDSIRNAVGMSTSDWDATQIMYDSNAGSGEWLQTIQSLARNSPSESYDPTKGIHLGGGLSVTQWISENWMLLVGGMGLAMILLPHTGRR